jgi:hypothetical protein
MAIELIDKIKQKNGGTFKLMDAEDIAFGEHSLTEEIDNVKTQLSEKTNESYVNAVAFGIKEGFDVNVAENTRIFQELIDYCADDKVIIFPSGDFVFNSVNLGEKRNITIKGASSPFASFAQKNIYTGEFMDKFTKIYCNAPAGETFFNHKSCVLILEDIAFYNVKKDDEGNFTQEEAKTNILMQHTRSEGAMKNIEKGKTFCFNSAFYGWKVVFGSDFTFQHLEEEWGTGKVEEEYEYFKQSCVVASRCRFTRNGIAINQSVDGRLVDCSFNKNDYAIVLRENSGFTTISNCRIEWNNYNGIYSEKAHEVTVSNCEFDCNGYAGLYAVENTNSNFNGIFRRNGAKVISDTEDTRDDFVNNVHIYAHRNVNCNFIGSNTTVKATSDVGSAPERPTNCSNFSENVNCVITSNNLYGCTKKDKKDANRFKNNVDCFFENNMSDNEVFDAKSAIAKTNAQLSADKNELNARIDTFLSLPEGSTTADAELMDIRVGRNGIVYDCAGTAVRQQFLDVETRLDGGELLTVSKSGDFFAEFDNIAGDISITSPTAINAFSYTKNLAPFEVIAKSSNNITIDEVTDEYVILTIQPNSPWQNITLKSFYLQEGTYVFTRYVEYLKGEPVNNAFTVYMDYSEDGKEFTSDNRIAIPSTTNHTIPLK